VKTTSMVVCICCCLSVAHSQWLEKTLYLPDSFGGPTGLQSLAYDSVGAKRAGPDSSLRLFLVKATGDLRVNGRASSDTYQIYFHVPIPFHEQAPVLLQVTCPQMIDYRFVQKDPPNLLVAARLANAADVVLEWTCWVLVKENKYADLPSYVPIPAPGELPDSVRHWLDTTDCCQVSAPIVQFKADSIRDTTTNLMKLAQDVCDFCHSIPAQFPHQPVGFDAVYALKWGNSCTGHAHAGAALLRACGIPARTLLNMPDNLGSDFDMHWIIDYYVPGYGWVRMETALGRNPMPPQDELVVQACNPCDEFPVWFPCGIDCDWHSSDTALGMWTPDWEWAHNATPVLNVTNSSEPVGNAIALTDSVFDCYSHYIGIRLTTAQAAAFQTGLKCQTNALDLIQAQNLTGYLVAMHAALLSYQDVRPAPIETLYSEDFESGADGWTHGGIQDEWELGVPAYGPKSAHSGANCWGTNLEGTYASHDDCWLASPRVYLTKLACANLSFWIWNSVQDVYGSVYDLVWVEISRDGSAFLPLSSRMGGVNDDTAITAVGGWNHVFLDLAQYLGDTVQIRFHFKSDYQIVFAGSYIDDFRITGRWTDLGIAEAPYVVNHAAGCLPTVVHGVLFLPERAGTRASLLDVAGRSVLDLHPGANDVSRLAPGVYFVGPEPSTMSRQPSTLTKVVLTK
jgi:transglutaminase-like putative cysteine protease